MVDTSIVVGCSSDIGTAICSALLSRGDRVVGTTRNGRCPASYDGEGDFHVGQCDVRNVESISQLFDAFSSFRPRHLIYCAGFHKLAPLSVLSDGAIAEHFAINLQGALSCSRFFSNAKYSCVDLQRSITVVSSIAHRVGEAGLIGYSASKAAVVSAVRCMAVEYGNKNIRVNSVSPGWVAGRSASIVSAKLSVDALQSIRQRYPLGFGEPSDVASAVSFLSSDGAKWISGIDLVVDGGRTAT